MYDNIEIQVRSLESLEVISDTYGQLLCPMILKLIPNELVLEFNKKRDDEIWSVEEIMKFIKLEIEGRERTNTVCGNPEIKQNSFQNFKPSNMNTQFNRSRYKENPKQKAMWSAADLMTTSSVNKKCLFCDAATNGTGDCDSLTVENKKQKLREQGRCFLCLQSKHLIRNCTSRIKCSLL